jgi:amino acid adenylation domain-containing protein
MDKLVIEYLFQKIDSVGLTKRAKDEIIEQASYSSSATDIMKSINSVSGNNMIANYTIFMTLYQVLLERCENLDDFLIASPDISMPNFEAKDDHILLFKSEKDSDALLKERIKFCQKEIQETLKYASYEFEELNNKLADRGIDKNTLLFYGFSCSGISRNSTHFKNSNFYLNLVIKNEDIDIHINYNNKLYSEEYARNFAGYYIEILKQFTSIVNTKSAEISFLTENQRNEIITQFNSSKASYQQKSIVELFEEHVKNNPNQIAVRWSGSSYSYKQINSMANAFANYICNHHLIEANNHVAIMLDRSEKMIVTMLAILKSGAAYLPIDPQTPEDRIQHILEDGKPKLIITDSEYLDQFALSEIPTFYMDLEFDSIDESEENLKKYKSLSNLAYTMFTSGSTGKPKGVMIEERSVIRLINNTNYIDIKADDKILALSNYSFDGSTFDIWGALLNGATLVISKKEEFLDFSKLSNTIKNENISLFFLTTALFNALVDTDLESFNSVRKLLFGGELVSLDHVKRFLKRYGKGKLVHVYGPTENTTFSTYYNIDSVDERDHTIPIGKPISNSECYILNENKLIQPVYVAGELCVSGDGLSKGYLNNQELTDLKFIKHPFKEGEKLYLTGDYAKWLPSGDIEFIGRVDNQVKIRGFRIELGEIENAIKSLTFVKEAAVFVHQIENSNKQIVAYYVLKNKEKSADIRQTIANLLPDYMVPSYFIEMEILPINKNGKVDQSKLPNPEEVSSKSVGIKEKPKNRIEEECIEIWTNVLGKNSISVTDDFFEVGGDSLKGAQIIARLNDSGYNISISDIFMYPSIRELSDEKLSANSSQVSLEHMIIKKLPKQKEYDVSYAQKRFWITHYMLEDSITYNVPLAKSFEGNVKIDLFEKAFLMVIKRHEILRTTYHQKNSKLSQVVHDDLKPDYLFLDIRKKTDQEKIIKSEQEIIYKNPFDLENGPLIRVRLYQIEDEKYTLITASHHIYSDGHSAVLMIKEIWETYIRLDDGITDPLPDLEIQFRDFATWQNNYLVSDSMDIHRAYWLNLFKDGVPVLELPTDKPRPPFKAYQGAITYFEIPKEISDKLLKLSEEQQVTLYMLFLGIFYTILYRYTYQEKIVIGTPIVERYQKNTENIIGPMINTLPNMISIDPNESFADFLKRVKEMALEVFAHKDYQFDMMVDELDLAKDMSRTPLYDVMIDIFTRDLMVDLENDAIFDRFKIRDIEVPFNPSHHDMLLYIYDKEEGLSGAIEYDTALFNQSTIDRFIENFNTLLESIVTDPTVTISEINLLSEESKNQIVSDFNNTDKKFANYDKLNVIEMFENQVLQSPDAIAVHNNSDSLTYSELNKKSNQFAHFLIESYEIKPNMMVGLMVERSFDMLISLLAILKAGAAYVAIDPELPKERISFILEDSETAFIVTLRKHTDLIDNYSNDVICYDEISEKIAVRPSENLKVNRSIDDNVYAVYTSGSTGTSKAAVLTHATVSNLINWLREDSGIHYPNRCLQFTSVNFCMSFTEIFGTLTSGGELFLISEEDKKDVAIFTNLLIEKKIDHISISYSFLNFLLNALDYWENTEGLHLRDMIVAGEQMKLTDSMIRFFKKNPQIRLYNQYGSSEVHVASSELVDFNEGRSLIPIGKPISNTKVYVLDPFGKILPIGVTGEIYASNFGKMKGYINREELTKEKYLVNQFDNNRMYYRTGDMGRLLEDGRILYFGREDFQYKIRGYRVESSEVEHFMLQFPKITNAVVMGRNDKENNMILVGYYQSSEEINVLELRSFLSASMPDYCIPSIFAYMDEFPRTTTNKIDRKNFPAPDVSNYSNDNYVEPANNTERIIAEIWAEVLQIEKVGRSDNFFNLGGHSLKAVQMVGLVAEKLEINIPLREVFYNPTIEAFSKSMIKNSGNKYHSISKVEEKKYYDVSNAQLRLWYDIEKSSDDIVYNMPIAYNIKGALDKDVLSKSFDALVKRHEVLRTTFKIIDDSLKQIIHDKIIRPIEFLKIEKAESSELTELVNNFGAEPFDLANGPLFKAKLLELKNDEFILLVNMHHIITDGWSIPILVKEFMSFYEFYSKKTDKLNLAELNIQYKDYSYWLNDLIQTGKLQDSKDFWLEKLQDAKPYLNLPFDFPQPLVKKIEGKMFRSKLDLDTSIKISQIAANHHTSIFIPLFGVFNLVMSHLTGQYDLTFASPVAGRTAKDLENQIGFYVNTLPLRTVIEDKSMSIKSYFEQVKESMIDYLSHQLYPYDLIVLDSKAYKLSDLNVVFSLQNNETRELEFSGLGITEVEVESTRTEADLEFHVIQYQDQLELRVHYKDDLFELSTIEYICRTFVNIVNEIETDEEMMIESILESVVKNVKTNDHLFNVDIQL